MTYDIIKEYNAKCVKRIVTKLERATNKLHEVDKMIKDADLIISQITEGLAGKREIGDRVEKLLGSG